MINNDRKPIVIALGYFDSLHIGHRKLLEYVKDMALKLNAKPAVLTFSNSLYSALGMSLAQIYTFLERKQIIHSLGIDTIISIFPDDIFINTSPQDFLEDLIVNNNIVGIVCGTDYKFGKEAKGGIPNLEQFASGNGIELKVVDLIHLLGSKVSSSDIRQMLLIGDIATANIMLGAPYSMIGRIVKGREVGRLLGFPTANLSVSEDKVFPRQGVYATSISIDGVSYKSLTHVGARPTFNVHNTAVESFIIDFNNKNIYDKVVKIYFYDLIRPIIKFDTPEDLIAQIKEDIDYSKQILRG